MKRGSGGLGVTAVVWHIGEGLSSAGRSQVLTPLSETLMNPGSLVESDTAGET